MHLENSINWKEQVETAGKIFTDMLLQYNMLEDERKHDIIWI